MVVVVTQWFLGEFPVEFFFFNFLIVPRSFSPYWIAKRLMDYSIASVFYSNKFNSHTENARNTLNNILQVKKVKNGDTWTRTMTKLLGEEKKSVTAQNNESKHL